MDNQSTPQVSAIESVLAKMKTAIGPVTKVMHRSDHFKVLVLGLNADVIFPDHVTKVPTKLTVLKGSVVYRDAGGNTPLFLYDELEITMNAVHSVRAIRPSVCLLTMG
jgi:hypothetical protein